MPQISQKKFIKPQTEFESPLPKQELEGTKHKKNKQHYAVLEDLIVIIPPSTTTNPSYEATRPIRSFT